MIIKPIARHMLPSNTKVYIIKLNNEQTFGFIRIQSISSERTKVKVSFLSGWGATDTCDANDSAHLKAVLACIDVIWRRSKIFEKAHKEDCGSDLFYTLYKDVEEAGTFVSLSSDKFKITECL